MAAPLVHKRNLWFGLLNAIIIQNSHWSIRRAYKSACCRLLVTERNYCSFQSSAPGILATQTHDYIPRLDCKWIKNYGNGLVFSDMSSGCGLWTVCVGEQMVFNVPDVKGSSQQLHLQGENEGETNGSPWALATPSQQNHCPTNLII